MRLEELLKKAATGDLATLVELDRRGLLMGDGEELQAYVERLECLSGNIREMDAELNGNGVYEVEGFQLSATERIPGKLFGEAQKQTEELFDFSIDWVPGFFITPKCGWLFAGCAFHFYPKFFALFIIRKAFATRERWLIYNRRELLAHELCHIARSGLRARLFEEMFAYKTASSSFRRALGSMFRTPTDSFMLLGSVFLLLGAQLFQTFSGLMQFKWMFIFWGACLATIGYLAVRHYLFCRCFKRACKNLELFAGDKAQAVLFRCTDPEILAIAQMSAPGIVNRWIEKRCTDSWRWKVIAQRFRL